MEIQTKFLTRIEAPITTGCWLWKVIYHPFGYGTFYHMGKTIGAHRMSWILFRGEIPQGLCVLHICDVPGCVNPHHLFLGTKLDNMRDCVAKGRHKTPGGWRNASKTHCLRGHEYDKENTMVSRITGKRRCRECMRIRNNSRNRRRKLC